MSEFNKLKCDRQYCGGTDSEEIYVQCTLFEILNNMVSYIDMVVKLLHCLSIMVLLSIRN